ncbi:MAG: zf-TFIIB domain-containing protein [Fimbriimonadales bacterium]
MARNCPSCSALMRIESIHGVELDVCTKCAGIWFDSDDLRVLLARDPLALTEIDEVVPHIEHGAGAHSALLCPQCGLRLEDYHYMYNSPVILQTCSNCGGFWVEEDELGKMQQWLEWSHQPVMKSEMGAYVVAEATIEHQKFMARQQNVQHLCSVMRQFQPGWYGFVP